MTAENFPAVPPATTMVSDSGIFEQELLDLLLGEAVTMQSLNVLRTEHNYSFKQHAHAIRPHGRQLPGDGFEHGFAALGIVFADAARWITGEERKGALIWPQTALHVQRLPGIFFFVFGEAIRKFSGIPQR